MSKLTPVTIYTDGACLGNPGPGGYGVVLLAGKHRKELSGGFALTTNNRMELMAAIVGLGALTRPCRVTLFTDSQYLRNGIEKGWARRWQTQGWRRQKNKPAKNADLWQRLLALCDKHEVTFRWVPGHAGIPENDRCDALALAAAQAPHLPPDPGHQTKKKSADYEDFTD